MDQQPRHRWLPDQLLLGRLGDGDLLKKDEDGNYMKDDAGNYVIDTDNLREPYSTLAPLTGPNGVNYASYAASSTQGLWYVTKWAENPDCASVLATSSSPKRASSVDVSASRTRTG